MMHNKTTSHQDFVFFNRVVQKHLCVCIFLMAASNMSSAVLAQNFSKVPTPSIPALTNAKAQWADFNNDGILDLFISGVQSGGAYHTAVYINNGDHSFNTINLTPLTDVAFDLGDFNRDGYMDIAVTGVNASAEKNTIIYRNNSGTGFIPQNFGIGHLARGGIVWEDLDSDGDLDLILTGLNASNQPTTRLYKYDGTTYNAVAATFTAVSNGDIKLFDADNNDLPEIWITGLDNGGSSRGVIYTIHPDLTQRIFTGDLDGWAFNTIGSGDYNQDGFEDIIVAGLTGDLSSSTTSLLQNNTVNGLFSVSTGFQNVSSSSVNMGDLNNDGLADIIITGIDDGSLKYFKYYRNSPGFAFTDVSHTMKNIYNGDLTLGDYDKDGDLDIFQIGNSDITPEANVYSSNQASTVVNNPPSLPLSLTSIVTIDSVYFAWTQSTDDYTHTNSISYNLYVSKDPSGANLVVSPLSNISNGFRRLPADGNAGLKNFKSIRALPEGRYYWSVQAIDNGFNGSSFAPEQSFAVCYPISLGNDTTICTGDFLNISIGDPSDVVNWYSKSGGLLTAASNSLSHHIIQNDTIIVELTKPYACTVYDTLIVHASLPPAVNLGNDTLICHGEQLTLTVSVPADSVNWYNLSEQLAANINHYQITVTQGETLIAETFNEFRCFSYDTIVVDVLSLPNFSVGNDTSICFQQELRLQLDGSWNEINWLSENGTLASDTNRYLLRVLTDTEIISEATDLNGCINYDTIQVSVLALPPAFIGTDTAICYREGILLEIPDNGNTVNWYTLPHQLVAADDNTYFLPVFTPSDIVAEVTDANNCTNYDTIHVAVLPLPVFNIGSDTAICFSENILLEAGSGFREVNWFSEIHNSLLSGNNWFYQHTVTETDTLIAEVFSFDGCVNYDSIKLEMIPLPVFSLGSDLNICYNDTVRLEVTGGWSDVNWFMEGDIMLQAEDPVFEFKSEETLTLWAETFNPEGCVYYDTLTVNTLPLPVFSLGNDTTYCYGDTVKLPADVPGAYEWKDVDGNMLSVMEEFDFVASSTTDVSLTITSADLCVYTDTVTINVNELPIFSIDGVMEICKHDSILLSITYDDLQSIRWHTDGSETPETTTDLKIMLMETTQVVATLTDINQCTSSDTVEIVVNERPVAYAGTDTLLCLGESAQIGKEYEPEITVQWSPDQFLSDAQAGNPIASPDSPITYVVTATNEKSCTDTDSVYIEVNPEIIIDAGIDTAICIGDSIKLGGKPTARGSNFGYTYQWMSDAGVIGADTANPTVKPTETTIYFVFVSSGKCQVEYDSIEVIVNPLPVIDIIGDQSIGAGGSVMLQVSGGVQYNWSPKESVDDNRSATPIAFPLKTTNYTVSVTDQNNCTDTTEVTVLVQNTLFIPSLFTPNNDGKNDAFRLYGSGVKTISLSVFDQNGKRVYQTQDPEDAFGSGWDGTFNGKALKNDTYIWTIEGEYYNGEPVLFEGNKSGIIKMIK